MLYFFTLLRYNGCEVIYMEDLEKILKQLYLVSGLNMSIFDINQKLLLTLMRNPNSAMR